jgi:putative transposase
MPWSHTAPMAQKPQFIADYLRDRLFVTELCALSAISRKTADKWIDRYRTHGPQGLEERSRRPHTSPRHTPDHVGAALLDARRRHPSWGAKQLVSILRQRHPHWPWPARSTGCDRLSHHGLVPNKRKRRALGHPGKPTSHISAPNAVWSADFKGQFKTGDGRYCYPRTIADDYSRFLLGCEALSSTRVQEAKPVFMRVFTAFGLPKRLRTDNGVPFATNTLGRRSQRSAWWSRLGIVPEFIDPGKPHQNGRHERMPRTLQADTTRPPGATLRAQQQKVTHFREEFNDARPHEALDLHPPASCYDPSSRKRPHTLPPLEDPDRVEGRYVSANGGIRWNHHGVNVSHVCVGASIGLEEIDDGVWNVYVGPRKLGRFLQRHMRIADAYGRLKRRR